MSTAGNTIVFRHNMSVSGDGERDALSGECVDAILRAVFSPGTIRDLLIGAMTAEGLAIASFDELMGRLRAFFADNSQGMFKQAGFGGLDGDFIAQAQRLADFERRFNVDAHRFDTDDKRTANVVYWPNPKHEKHPSSLFDELPYTQAVPLIDKSTPIGSAGSCFASEIAWYLQDNGYNYVVEEFDQRDAPKPESPARWGIIFNTPSFTQLAEKAFGLRSMPNLAEYHFVGQYWQDPFRENVAYPSIEALEADRQNHVDACRHAFTKCKVFIITLGLNECWEYIPDGTVASRNPKTSLHFALFRHRVLSVQDNVQHLQRFLDVLRANNPDIKLIVTVSPVPFMATGLGAEKHVVVANAHSKAVLRVAAEEFVGANEGVHYFPSYEMVSHCIERPWEDDQRHVHRRAVARIMQLFEEMFVTGDAARATAAGA
ncbi:MAG: GSCFA domain-containing protein [Rhodospirillaceae bacterium]